MRGWVNKMANKSASEELNDEEIRQLKYDLEHELQKFKDILN